MGKSERWLDIKELLLPLYNDKNVAIMVLY